MVIASGAIRSFFERVENALRGVVDELDDHFHEVLQSARYAGGGRFGCIMEMPEKNNTPRPIDHTMESTLMDQKPMAAASSALSANFQVPSTLPYVRFVRWC